MAEETIAGAAPDEAKGPLGWYTVLSKTERRTLWACIGGWGLDGMDSYLYTYVIPTLIALWGISRGQAGSIVTVGLMSSSLGGWAAGALADRYGRVKMLQLSVLWFSVFTFLSGLATSYPQLLVLRALHGLGFGGEWAVGVALIGEMIRDKYRATATGTVHSVWAIGGGLAALFYAVFFSLLPDTIAWRAYFMFGVLPAFFVLYIRRYIPEPPIFLETKKQRETEGAASFLEIFSPELLKFTILGGLVAAGMLGGAYAVQTWLPTYLKTVRHLSVINTSAYVVVFQVAHFFGYIGGAYLADRIGRRLNFVFFAAATALTVALYMFLPIGNTVMLILGALLGFFSAGGYGGLGATYTEIFPTRVRASGAAFCYNFGRALGALFPMLVGFLSAALPLGATIGIFTVGAYGIVVIAGLLLPETKGRALTR